jgi:PPOX class probable F420-dependent enzyme
MNMEEAREFLRTNRRAVFATRRSDGGMQMSPILMVLDDDGTLIISTRETAIKTRNLRRDPYAYAVVLNDQFYGQFLQVEGTCAIESLPDAMEGLVKYYRMAAGEHENWDEYREAMARDKRVLVRMTIERVGPNVSG